MTALKRAGRATACRHGVGREPVAVIRRAVRTVAKRWLAPTHEITTTTELDDSSTSPHPAR